jgi:hypothetical protein
MRRLYALFWKLFIKSHWFFQPKESQAILPPFLKIRSLQSIVKSIILRLEYKYE